ncbi:MAG: esterase [Elusimicrobia bacterium]|nr:esterase [Elusimicrobiota bacterium]
MTTVREAAGTLVIHRHESRVLAGNALGDPTVRDLYVYLPPGYESEKDRTYPVLLGLSGFTGTGASMFNVDPLGEDLKRRMDRLVSSGKCQPVIIAAPDCFTRLGGNQYINSSATGAYEDYLVDEIVPFVRKTYRAGRFGVFGKSSGGYGSIVLGMRRPEVFEALADHSGDSCFELSYIPDFPKALDSFKDAGGPKRWLEKFWANPNRQMKKNHAALNMLAMAAHYSPEPSSPHLGVEFPFDLETGKFKPDVWKRWQVWDPVNMVERYVDNLRRLRLIYIDCGSKDEFALHWGARALVAAMRRHQIQPHHEEFDDGHMSIAYRYDASLPLLAKALQ